MFISTAYELFAGFIMMEVTSEALRAAGKFLMFRTSPLEVYKIQNEAFENSPTGLVLKDFLRVICAFRLNPAEHNKQARTMKIFVFISKERYVMCGLFELFRKSM